VAAAPVVSKLRRIVSMIGALPDHRHPRCGSLPRADFRVRYAQS
jgi:hypothetical protein